MIVRRYDDDIPMENGKPHDEVDVFTYIGKKNKKEVKRLSPFSFGVKAEARQGLSFGGSSWLGAAILTGR